tara:strand:+ start:93 stop:461 length:369 start_codon:yes stop_codon:yes gene_type:complete
MYYYFYTSSICSNYLKHITKKNCADIENIQTMYRDEKDVSYHVNKSIDFNLNEIEKNPCSSTFKKYNIDDFFLFYNTVLKHHKEQYNNSNKGLNETFQVLGFVNRFNNHLDNISKKLNKHDD